VKAIADHGARFVGCNVMFLEGGTREHFMRWLAGSHPALVEGYERLYGGKYPPSAYRRAVATEVEALRQEHRLGERESRAHQDPPAQPATREAEQQMLRW
jgi:hypothetical protein